MTHKQRYLRVGLLVAVANLAACARSAESSPAISDHASVTAGALAAPAPGSPVAAKAAATNRKIVRQAELELEVPVPSATQTALERLAEQHGGYVVSAARDTENGSAIDVRVTVVVRVPQAELTATISELKRFGRGVGSEKITSDDVTDEYIDLTARIVSQKGLEQQYLEILKRAVTVKDAMDVQKELAEVRTTVEQMQGRQQLLDKESAFSTLTVHLTGIAPQIAISPSGFGSDVKRACSDALSLSADLISFAIRSFGVLVPVLLLLVLPGVLGVLALRRILRGVTARRLKALT